METRRMCPHCRAFITTKDRVCPYCNEAVAPRRVERDSSAPILGGLIPQVGFNIIVILLINFGFYVATSITSVRAGEGSPWRLDGQTMFLFGAKWAPAIGAGQWWRLVTAGFLHWDLLHIGMNSWVLFDLGAQTEDAYGSARMLVIYFVSSVLGFYLSALLSPGSLSAGASAALFGLLGAMIAFTMRHGSALADAMRAGYVRWLVLLLIMSLFGNVDLMAHVGGLAGGFGTGWIATGSRLRGSGEGFWRIAAWIAVGLTAFSFLKWYLWFSSAAQ
jgi:rhomboid protease GluP